MLNAAAKWEERRALVALALLIIVMSILIVWITKATFMPMGQNQVRREAVLLGFAEYKTDENGAASFTWKVPAEKAGDN